MLHCSVHYGVSLVGYARFAAFFGKCALCVATGSASPIFLEDSHLTTSNFAQILVRALEFGCAAICRRSTAPASKHTGCSSFFAHTHAK